MKTSKSEKIIFIVVSHIKNLETKEFNFVIIQKLYIKKATHIMKIPE
mgnify:FL=1